MTGPVRFFAQNLYPPDQPRPPIPPLIAQQLGGVLARTFLNHSPSEAFSRGKAQFPSLDSDACLKRLLKTTALSAGRLTVQTITQIEAQSNESHIQTKKQIRWVSP